LHRPRCAWLNGLGDLENLLDEFIGHSLIDVNAFGANTSLTGVGESRPDRGICRTRDIGIVSDNDRIFTATFKNYGCHLSGTCCGNNLGCASGTSEGQLIDATFAEKFSGFTKTCNAD